MKKKSLVLLIGVMISGVVLVEGSSVLIITGIYSGENLYVQNPWVPNKYFSTEKVYVNQALVLSNPLTSAFTIDLSHLTINQRVEVRIVHQEHYPPRIINAHVIGNREADVATNYAPSRDVFRWTNVDGTTIRWLTHGEKGGGTFEIQKAVSEDWIIVDKIPAKSASDNSVYRALVTHEDGENTYRIKLTDKDGYVSYSDDFRYDIK